MRFKGILFFVIILVFWIGTSEAQRKKTRRGRKDGCHLREIEFCINKVQDLGKRKNPSVLIASNDGLNTICQAIKVDLSKCIKTFMKKCGSPLHRELVELVMEQMNSHVTKFCNEKNPDRKEFLKHSPCIHRKVFISPEYRTTCNNNFLATVDALDAQHADGDKTHSAVCCGYNTWHECTKKMVIHACGKEAHESFSSFIGGAFGALPHMACPMEEYGMGSKSCSALPPPRSVGHTKAGKGKGHNKLTKWITSHLSFLFVLD